MAGKAILLIGGLTHSRKEWEEMNTIGDQKFELKTYPSGSRQDFMGKCKSGEYDNVVALYRSNASNAITGPFNAEMVEQLPSSLKFICHNGAGYDNIDVPACTAKEIQVSSTPKAVDDATADTAILLMLGALRQAWKPISMLKRGEWPKNGNWGSLGHDPRNKVLGILGMGSIGRAVATRARGFGMEIQYFNRSRLSPELEHGAKYVSFEELLKTSDVLSINCALTKETRHLIGKAELAKMKKGVTIVNTARGPVIDEKALVEALDDGDKIWSVGLDVYEKEPEIEKGLLENDRVFLLPHIGTATFETQREMELLVLNNIKSGITEGKLLTRVAEQKDAKF